MKKPVAIIAILLALVVIIGIDQFGQGFGFLISDERHPRSRDSVPTASPEQSFVEPTNTAENQTFHDSTRTAHRDSASPNYSGATTGSNDAQQIAIRVTGEVSPVHFIRSSTILGADEPTKNQIARLREAVAVVGEQLSPSAVIFDSDAISPSKAPVILFVREAFDLTSQVKLIYDTLDKASNFSHHETPPGEQAVGGNLAIAPMIEFGACPAGATTLRSAQKMKITYTPIWKRTTRGSVLCGGLGFLAGSACGLWMPHALIAAGVLAVIAGMIFDEGTVIESSFLFVIAGAMGMTATMSIGDPDSPSSVQARHFASATPWQIVWVIPLQIVGYGLRILVRRMLRQPHAEQAVSGNRR